MKIKVEYKKTTISTCILEIQNLDQIKYRQGFKQNKETEDIIIDMIESNKVYREIDSYEFIDELTDIDVSINEWCELDCCYNKNNVCNYNIKTGQFPPNYMCTKEHSNDD